MSSAPVPHPACPPSFVKSDLRTLYPPIEPFNTGFLQVSPLHSIYYEQVGNPNGKKVIHLHGGPGGGISGDDRRFYDPEEYHIILFDQRGAGKSTPHACLEENTTWHLVSDIEALRKHLGIEKWLVFGGSWGSSLALAYAETHPESVTELVLRGIFLIRKFELDWFYQYGAHMMFPDMWEHYVEPIPEDERHNLMAAYYKRLTGDDKEEKIRCAKAWSIWEGSTSKLLLDPEFVKKYDDDEFAEAFARIECHYFMNLAWLEDNQLIKNVGKIRHIPTTIVQGRYDMVCPAIGAYDISKAWPEAEFIVIPDAGHSAKEVGITDALVRALDKFKSNK